MDMSGAVRFDCPVPIYEFRCQDCMRITNHFTRKIDTAVSVACDHCGSENTARMMSAFGRSFSRSDILERHGDPSAGDGSLDDYRDPRQIGGWVEKQFADHGVEMPTEARAMIDRARAGDLPDAIQDL